MSTFCRSLLFHQKTNSWTEYFYCYKCNSVFSFCGMQGSKTNVLQADNLDNVAKVLPNQIRTWTTKSLQENMSALLIWG